jgi:hypothetical protein
MTASSFVLPSRRRSLWIVSLIAASVLFSFAFTCAAPLAAFAAIAALTTGGRREALMLTGAIWFANQAVGFLFLHYPTQASTLAWGGAMGVISLLSCEAAVRIARRLKGLAGAGAAFVAAFLAAFVVYKGLIFGFGAAMGSSAGHVDSMLATLPRIFLINACVFAGLGALFALGSAARRNGETAALTPRHV